MNDSFFLFTRVLGALVAFGSGLALVACCVVEVPPPRVTSDVRSAAFPQRKHLLALALGFTCFVVYGSLVPLHFRALSWTDAIQRFVRMSFPNPYVLYRADWVANILLFIPVGFLWLAVWLVDRPSRLRASLTAPAVIIGCAILSCAVEFSQTWSPTRTVSHNDILAETLGGITGVIFWLVVGPAATDWIRGYSRSATRPTRLQWWLQVYFFGLVVYSLLPFDLCVSRREILRKFEQGKIELMPFVGWTPTLGNLRASGLEMLIWIPVGCMCMESFRGRRTGLRWFVDSLLLGMILVLSIETMQVLIYSRYSSTTDLILGTVGVAIGGLIVFGWNRTSAQEIPNRLERQTQPSFYSWLALSCLYLPVILYMFCTPLDFVRSQEELSKGWRSFWSAPFSSMYWGTEFNAVTVVLRDILYFAPLGFFLGSAVVNLNLPPARQRRWLWLMLLPTGGLALAVELFQIVLRQRVPDLTDTMFSTLGASFGLMLAAQLSGSADGTSENHDRALNPSTERAADAAPKILRRVLILLLVVGILLVAAAGIPQWILRHRRY